MEIKIQKIKISDLVNEYIDNNEEGVKGYGGKLDIRPPYQREFVYKDEQRNGVIQTVQKQFPLNVMYWAVKNDGEFEVIDGQQRTISICQFVNGDYSINDMYFHTLKKDQQDLILNYELDVYLCSGTDSEKLEWFKTINIAGEKLTNQELRNAVYAGSWVTDAKRHFSKNQCAAYNIGNKYLSGAAIRQDYLETAIKWISENNIEGYMAKNQNLPNANKLWAYFRSVIEWVELTFPKYRKEMKNVPWGELYNEFKDEQFDTDKLEKEIADLMEDEDVTNKKGIYSYVLTRKEKYLSVRAFSEKQKREAYERQDGICPKCGNHFEYEEMQGDHIVAWSKGGKTTAENCQMLCAFDNGSKSGK